MPEVGVFKHFPHVAASFVPAAKAALEEGHLTDEVIGCSSFVWA
jgi:hypothetical protein